MSGPSRWSRLPGTRGCYAAGPWYCARFPHARRHPSNGAPPSTLLHLDAHDEPDEQRAGENTVAHCPLTAANRSRSSRTPAPGRSDLEATWLPAAPRRRDQGGTGSRTKRCLATLSPQGLQDRGLFCRISPNRSKPDWFGGTNLPTNRVLISTKLLSNSARSRIFNDVWRSFVALGRELTKVRRIGCTTFPASND